MHKFYKVSKKAHSFIEEHFEIYGKCAGPDFQIDIFVVPYSRKNPAEASERHIAFFFIRKPLDKQTYCSAHLLTTKVPLKNPKQYLKLLMKWHPATDIYSCERALQLHNALKNELGHESKNISSRTKI